MNGIYQVRELTASIKSHLEGAFPFVWVQGQISNLSRPASGHLYFSLKDEEAALTAVWFRASQQNAEAFDPLTGEVYEEGPRVSLAGKLENGMEVICAGRISVYAPRGSYQLVVELVQESGKGRLQIEFERLQAELASKGYFDPLRKRPLPQKRGKVAVITSPHGAAIHDFLRICSQRGLNGEIRIYPVPVQGEDAPPLIVEALRAASAEGWADVIVLIRGGGSPEDLWAFNSRDVAEAVFSSPIPVLAGIGHEVDFTLADMTADLRAATPTHAAQLLWPERKELVQRLDEAELSVMAGMQSMLERKEAMLQYRLRSLQLLSPVHKLETVALRVEHHMHRVQRCMEWWLAAAEERLTKLAQRLRQGMAARLSQWDTRLCAGENLLRGLNPELPLQRGYAMVKTVDGRLLRSVLQAEAGDRLVVQLADGTLPVIVEPPAR